MEVSVQASDGFELPPRCHVSVRVGDSLKQGRYDPKRRYIFPDMARRRHARIDIFQHLGSCSLALDPEDLGIQDLAVEMFESAMPARLKVSSHAKATEVQQETRDAKKKSARRGAKEYLLKHRIEDRFAASLKAVLREMPEDPVPFICECLSGGRWGPAQQQQQEQQQPQQQQQQQQAETAAEPPAPAPSPPVADDAQSTGALPGRSPDVDAEVFRQKCKDLIAQAVESGKLAAVLTEVSQRTSLPAASAAAAGSAPEAAEANVCGAKLKACEELARAAQDGRLRQALLRLTADDGASALRRRYCEFMVEASATGKLDAVLAEAKQEPSVTSAPAKAASLQSQACGALARAVEDGTLQQALLQSTPGGASASLRQRCGELIVNASVDGKLDAALAEAMQVQSMDAASVAAEVAEKRTRACGELERAAEDGRLRQALLQSTPGGPLRQRCGGLLVDASLDGKLEAVLAEVQSMDAASVPAGAVDKRQACCELARAAEDGTLRQALLQSTPGGEVVPLRQRCSELLVDASVNGKLEATLAEEPEMAA